LAPKSFSSVGNKPQLS